MKDKQQENEATHFAMCLLIPRHMVHEEYEKLYPNGIELTSDESGIKELADKFQVTEQMMWIRLAQLSIIR